MTFSARMVRLARDLVHKVRGNHVGNGAAALAFYSILSIFPATIFLLSVLPYLPIPRLEQAIVHALEQIMPGRSAGLFAQTVHGVVASRRGGLLSFGLVLTLWSGSKGLYAAMQELNIVCDVRETRSFWKTRAISLLLFGLVVVLLVATFALVIFGGGAQAWLGTHLGWSAGLLALFAGLRWVVLALGTVVTFSLLYSLGPDAKRRFRWISPASVATGIGVLVVSALFRLVVAHVGRFGHAYGALSAVIMLLIWLYLLGWVVLLGGELDALLARDAPGASGARNRDASGAHRRSDSASIET